MLQQTELFIFDIRDQFFVLVDRSAKNAADDVIDMT